MSNNAATVPLAPTNEAVSTSNPHPDANVMDEGRLFRAEIFWRDRNFWFKDHGYLLRPRYHPEWVASWKNNDKIWLFCENAQIGEVM